MLNLILNVIVVIKEMIIIIIYTKHYIIYIKNIITNKISYNYADMCITNENKCGNEGTYFEQEKNIELKIFTHQIISRVPNILMVFIYYYKYFILGKI